MSRFLAILQPIALTADLYDMRMMQKPMVKDSKKYFATGGWAYAQFDKDGKPADAAKHETCYPCHVPAKDRDYVFTHYAP